MLERIISFFLEQRFWTAFVLVALTAAGLFSTWTLSIDAFPDLTNNQVEVVGTASSLSPLEMERLVTYPVERSMQGLPGLVLMRSVSKFGISIVTLVFEEKTDVYFARQLVLERLLTVRDKLPDGVETELGPMATAMGEIYQYTLEREGSHEPAAPPAVLAELRTIQDWVVAPMLKTVRGVNEVNSFGGYLKQYQVLVDPAKLLAYNLTLDDVYETLRNNNQNAGGGVLEEKTSQYTIRGLALLGSCEEIGRVVLKSREGTPILVRDVASVSVGEAVRQGAAIKDGRGEAVGGIVMLLRGANSREVVGAVKSRVEEINRSGVLPKGVRLKAYYDRSNVVDEAIFTLVKALLEGALFIFIVLYLFLGNVRGALVVILTLPVAALTVFTVMRMMGLTANLISLGGLAISIGMIVDSAIIQVENVQRRLSEAPGETRVGTILRAVLEVRKPSIFGELIIAITFLPILSLEGLEGRMFRPLALTIFIALLAALFLSLVVTPFLCRLFIRGLEEKEGLLVRVARRLYLPCLSWAMARRRVTLALAGVLLVAGFCLFPLLGSEFMPVMDEGAFDMDVQLPTGVSVEQSLKTSQQVGAALMKFPELDTVVSRTGWSGMAIESRGVESTGFVGILKPRDRWTTTRTREELVEKMRAELSGIPGLAFSFSQPIQCRVDELVSGTRAQVVIKLFGESLEILRAKGDAIARTLGEMKGVRDLMVEQVAGQPYVNIRVDRAALATCGLRADEVLHLVQVGLAGKATGRVFEGDRFFDLQVRLASGSRSSVEALRSLLVAGNGEGGRKHRIPLSSVASITTEEGPVRVGRENGQRVLLIQCNVDGRDLGGFVTEAQERIRHKVRLPQGYYLAWGGQFENQQRAMARLSVIVPITIVMIAFLLFATFDSWRQARLILLNLPLAVLGGILALYASGLYLSVPASVGFITLLGVAVLNGLVLVNSINQLREAGMGLHEAIVEGCVGRLRPVMMTATVACFSLIPMLFATGPGSEIQKPLAVVVIGGLVTSTLLTLLLLPVFYSWTEEGAVHTSTVPGGSGGLA